MNLLAIPEFGKNLDKKNLGVKWIIVYKTLIVKKRM